MMHQHQAAANILANAFHHYPTMRYAFKGLTDDERLERLKQLFGPSVYAASLYGGVLVNTAQTAALTWISGTFFPLSLWNELKAGMAMIPLRAGISNVIRLVNHDAESELIVAANSHTQMGYIWCVGVDENERGKGLSRQLIDQAIADMKAKQLIEFWLKTDLEKNVAIYERMGFEVYNHFVAKSSGLPSWVMVRRK